MIKLLPTVRPATPQFLNLLDIVGYNYVDRWRERRELYYDIDKRNHPEWKITGTENISISGIRGNYYGGGIGRVDSSAVRPANLPNVIRAEQLWKFVSLHDYVIGDFMWTGIDYLGESRWPSKNASSGVIDLCGFPKDAYYFYQSQWTSKPVVHLAPHWNWKGKEGQVIQVMAYTNCDTVELFFEWKIVWNEGIGISKTHGNFPNPAAIARARKLGVVFDIQPFWLYLDGPAIKDVFGPDRMKIFSHYVRYSMPAL